MEIVKYLCEFFFGNFWHCLGLLFILCVVCNIRLIDFRSFNVKKDKDEDNDENKYSSN